MTTTISAPGLVMPTTASQVEPRYLLGIQMRLLIGGGQTRGRFAVYEATVPAGVFVPLHTHAPAEAFYVLEGEFEFGRAGAAGEVAERLPAPAETAVLIPPGAIHSFKNVGRAAGRMLVICDAGLQPFFDEAAVGKASPEGQPAPEEVQRVMGVMAAHQQMLLGPHPEG